MRIRIHTTRYCNLLKSVLKLIFKAHQILHACVLLECLLLQLIISNFHLS